MKKIYASSDAELPAAVVLDDAEEIRVVVDALRQYITRVQWPADNTIAATLLGEMTAPAP